jgi:suppressor of fused
VAAGGGDPGDVAAPGWDAIDGALAALYPDVDPLHVAPTPGPAFGGGVQGISAFPAEGHWHLVTYGLSELYEKESDDPDLSGYGYELTLRVSRAASDGRPPDWALNLLEQVARVQRSGVDFWIGHRLDAGPIDGESSGLTHLAFAVDPELGRIDTPHGELTFLQLVGVTEDEAAAMRASTTEEVLAGLAGGNPLLVTDVARA